MGALLALFVTIGLWYSIAIPPGEGVDEAAHFAYVRYVADEWRLPVQPLDDTHPQVWMGHHPPLYYFLGALVIAPVDTQSNLSALRSNPHFRWDEEGDFGWNVMLPVPTAERWRGALLALQLLRWMGIVFGAVAIRYVYASVRLLLPQHPWAALGAGALIGLNPSFLYMASTVHHDVLLSAIAAAGLYLMLTVAFGPVRLRGLLLLGLLCGAAVLTKLSGAVLPVTAAFILLLRPRQTGDWANRWLHLAAVTFCALFVAGWWLVRNQLLYGDPLGWQMFLITHSHMVRPTAFTWGIFVEEFLAQIGKTFWGAFGFMHILLPVWMRQIAWSLSALAALGLIVQCARIIRTKRWDKSTGLAWAAICLLLMLLFASFVRFAQSTLGAGHGRYLFPGATTIGALLIVSLNGYFYWRGERMISLAALVVMTAYAIFAPVRYVLPLYRLPDLPSAAQVAGARQLDIAYPGGFRLMAAQMSSAVVIPGQGLDATTYWQADADVASDIDPYVTLSLVGSDGGLLGSTSFWPEIATVPSVWDGRTVVNRQSFYVPPDVAAGSVLMRMEVLAGREGSVLSTSNGEESVTLAEMLALGAVVQVDAASLPISQRNEVFAGALRLAGVTLPDTIAPGEILPVQLFWEVLSSPSADYTIFVHLVDANDQIVAQLDRPPGGGISPTTSWLTGMFLQDTYPIPLPSELADGIYRVRFGLYTWPDLARQPVTSNGSSIGDSVVIGQVEIGP